MPSRKKRRTNKERNHEGSNQNNESLSLGIDVLSTVPLELLAMILSYTSTKEILALTRTSQYFHRTLAQNPNSEFIWRNARLTSYQDADNCPCPIPDPTPNFTECSYAAFIFDGGICESCGEHTSEMYDSFALRLRFCHRRDCHDTWMKKSSVYRYGSPIEGPPVPNLLCHEKHYDPFGFELGSGLFRRSEVENVITEGVLRARAAENDDEDAQSLQLGQIGGRPVRVIKSKPPSKKCIAIMSNAHELFIWKHKMKEREVLMHALIDKRAQMFALNKNVHVRDLLSTPTYLKLHRHKKLIVEDITDEDTAPIMLHIDSELLALRSRQLRRDQGKLCIAIRRAVEYFYNRMKSLKQPPIMPPLSIYRCLPAVQRTAIMSKGPHDESVDEFEEKVEKEVREWAERAEEQLGAILGFPGSRPANQNDGKLHPVHRATARFTCKLCSAARCAGAAKSEKLTAVNGSLDFAMACSHVCIGLSNKRRSKYPWSADQFLPDEKAIKVIRKVLHLLNVNEEDPASLKAVEGLGDGILCLSCSAPIRMKFSHMIGHCRRHEDMDIRVITATDAGNRLAEGGGVEGTNRQDIEIDYGICAQLQGRAKTRRKRAQKIYGCRHCLCGQTGVQSGRIGGRQEPRDDEREAKGECGGEGEEDEKGAIGSAETGPGRIKKGGEDGSASLSETFRGKTKKAGRNGRGKGESLGKAMSFDGLRCHLKTCHDVGEMRDEDLVLMTGCV